VATIPVIQFDDDPPDDEFPLGDGTAETAAHVACPYCGAENDIAIDPGNGESQEYVEDCAVCCRPWLLRVHYGHDGLAQVEVERADED